MLSCKLGRWTPALVLAMGVALSGCEASKDGQDPFPDLMPSGSLRPVPPGIYDLAGNAEEWCSDKEIGDDEVGGIYFRCRKSSASGGRVRSSFSANQGFRCVEE